MSCDNLHVGPENPLNVLCFSDAARRRPYPLIAHCSQLITHNSKICRICVIRVPMKILYKTVFLSKSSWKVESAQLENYFFSVGKSNFRSRAILDDFFGSLMNYFKRFFVHFDTMCGSAVKSKNV